MIKRFWTKLIFEMKNLAHLNGDESVFVAVPSEPNGWELSPSEFPDAKVPALGEQIAQSEWVIAAGAVIERLLLLVVVLPAVHVDPQRLIRSCSRAPTADRPSHTQAAKADFLFSMAAALERAAAGDACPTHALATRLFA